MKIVFTLLFLLAATLSFAQTNVGGTFFSNQYWPLSGSPYIVTTDVQMAPGFTLTIDPGVHVQFNGGHEILIKGGISALGTLGNEIVFDGTSATNVIHFMDADLSASHLSYCTMTGGTQTINMDGSCSGAATLPYMTLANGSVYQSGTDGGTLSFTNATFDNMLLNSGQSSGNLGQLKLTSCTVTNSRLSASSTSNLPSHLAIEVNISNLDNTHFEVYGNYARSLLLQGDTLRNCFFHSSYCTAMIDNCYIEDSEFSNFGVIQGNQFRYEISNSTLIGTDIIGGTVNGNAWYTELTFSNCLIERTATTQFTGDVVNLNNCAVLGDGASMGVHATYLTAHHSLFKNHQIATRFGHTYSLTSLYLDHCNFIGITDFNAICDTTYGTDAQGSWWGTADSLTIFNKIDDYYDNLLHGEVVLGQWATTPDTNAPMSPPSGLGDVSGSGFHTISWNANAEADLIGYMMYVGVGDGYRYAQAFNMGNVTSYQVPDSLYNQGIAITAYDRNLDGYQDIVEGHESGFARLGGPLTTTTPPTTEALGMTVYPNPATDHVTVRLDRAMGKGDLQVMDLSGRVLRQVPIVGGETLVDVAGLPAGMYLVRVQNGKQVGISKLVLR